MSPGDGSEPIADDEVVFRRISDRSGWYNPSLDRPVAWEAFRPNENDVRGLSVWRAKYISAPEAAARGARPGRRYFVLRMRVGRLRTAGVQVEPSPAEGGPGHATLANLTASAYRDRRDAIREVAEQIATSLIESVDGPFGPFGEAPE
jgi:hypothetical protein